MKFMKQWKTLKFKQLLKFLKLFIFCQHETSMLKFFTPKGMINSEQYACAEHSRSMTNKKQCFDFAQQQNINT